LSIEVAIATRLDQLIEEGEALSIGNEQGQVDDEDHRQECSAWLVSAHSLVYASISDASQPYRQQIDRICTRDRGYTAHNYVGEARQILLAFRADATNGLVSSLLDSARAEVFDDFMDHAVEYLKQKRKNEAGTIAGVVFEDAIRRAHRKHVGPEKGTMLDEVISELARRNLLSAVKAKRARAAAHVRTKATHAQWDEFELDDVAAAIEFTRGVVAELVDR